MIFGEKKNKTYTNKRAFPQKTTFPRKPNGADDDAFTGRRARMRCQPQREE